MDSITQTIFAQYAWGIVLLPLLAFVVNGLLVPARLWRVAGWFSVLCAAGSLALASGLALAFYHGLLAHEGFLAVRLAEIPWLPAMNPFSGNSWSVSLGFLLDPISVVMMVVITIISLLVHFYSLGYMREDASPGRFFALLSFFTFSMLGLVISTNLVQIYVFWELVGVASYLLIGFWYHKPSAVAASKKAFILTRFADAFFLLGILIVAWVNQGVDFDLVNSAASAERLNHTAHLGFASVNLLTLATLFIFAGGWGKSAMFPLHVWLPDAMEGPTPVSSIIHSATMVVAGVFLTARMMPLFFAADVTLQVVEAVGAFTALFAAVIACTQSDTKRILAFSTLSQIGYMMFALGTARYTMHGETAFNALGYSASMFHIFTHAFFKCLLFLSAGLVIHAAHTNNVLEMGGLRKSLPLTHVATLIACLAIAGIFPFAGFFSKDAILLTAFQNGHYLTFAVGLAVGGITAFYMFRYLMLIFYGAPRGHGHHHDEHVHSHEDFFMTLPVVLLAVPSIFAGWLAQHLFETRVIPPFAGAEGHFAHPAWLPYLASAVGMTGALLAVILYAKGPRTVSAAPLYRLVQNKFYVDEVYLWLVHRIIFPLVAAPMNWFDKVVVDGSMNAVAWCLQQWGQVARAAQNGQVQLYMAATFLGFVLLYFFGRLPV